MTERSGTARSARNRLVGLVTAVTCGDVAARVELLCGKQLVEAVVKATDVVIERCP